MSRKFTLFAVLAIADVETFALYLNDVSFPDALQRRLSAHLFEVLKNTSVVFQILRSTLSIPYLRKRLKKKSLSWEHKQETEAKWDFIIINSCLAKYLLPKSCRRSLPYAKHRNITHLTYKVSRHKWQSDFRNRLINLRYSFPSSRLSIVSLQPIFQRKFSTMEITCSNETSMRYLDNEKYSVVC